MSRLAGAVDAPVASAVLGDAFADSPWTRWTVDADDHVARITALQRLVIEQVAIPFGEVWVAEDEQARIASVAIWMLPAPPVPPAVWESIATAQSELEGSRHSASVAAEAAVLPLRPVVPHYYLGAVGTRSDCQGRGFATAVLAPVLERATVEGAIVFLETSKLRNVAFYERRGFVVTGELDVPGGGPHVWGMTRR